MEVNNERTTKIRKDIVLYFSITICIIIIATIVTNQLEKIKPKEYNEKATIEYLKNFAQGDIKKIIILTEGYYSKFAAVCLFIIKDKEIIKKFQTIVERQDVIVKKNAWGQTDREYHITLYNNKNEMYSFILDGDPYSGKRPVNEMEISFFRNPSFDVSDNWQPEPDHSINKNSRAYGLISSNLQNYELYYFLKKYIIDFTEENRKNTEGISSKCYITKRYK